MLISILVGNTGNGKHGYNAHAVKHLWINIHVQEGCLSDFDLKINNE